MLDSVIFKSIRSAHTLTFSNPKPPHCQHPVSTFTATLRDRDWVVSTVVYLYEPTHLAHFFEALATDWQGWNEPKQWISIESHITLRCVFEGSSDLSPVVEMSVSLTPDPDQPEKTVQGMIYLKATELGAIAFQLKKFLHL
ncbi:MAG: DUF6228 family protein [Oculatellaceae cyanobacterium bins.114]|nr:DUF6228 family protein [Oculatellaceae cyanobacterium bins.114]